MSEDVFNAAVVEALILASPEPLPARKIAEQLEDLTPAQVGRAVAALNDRYFQAGASFRIREIAGGFQFYILPEFTGYVEEMFTRRRKMRLTRAALETLAIVAYRQPVTKAEIEHIRGVASDGVLQNLLEKNMVAIRGRAATVGKPLQYGTTDEFLKFFGLAGLDDLPKMKEIEELIRAAEPDNGDQLSFETSVLDVAMARKLNVADGTFDPQTREADPQDDDRPAPPPGAPDNLGAEPPGADDADAEDELGDTALEEAAEQDESDSDAGRHP
ncbi:MAG TPA: SMC-Scp complex subunit ScpB [candidate division Zixibacteria bacterium]|nr:SMC-Scp complex subunit ScpB [candidate division Zixibacteria bacterium]MDD4917892.1 SMC-Scp complex subunit ScpB [candidate division Zixibacteria bacterium]MDM7973496.1 SMC-Scp complex subunit ScpB [candidate division Zixibacteria bacterium]HOD66224.1 SMC-Scp complex subunit ScpB [candidate division Zixibacteria bacterium]HOZ08519.1 SMC-Scp complex subunit ScpB [candidate division Zixibacteria bacterium]